MAGVNMRDLVLDVEHMLYGLARIEAPAEDTLKTQVTDDADVEWQFDTSAMWKRGDFAEYAPLAGTGEIIRFTEDHQAGETTVRRGQRGTTIETGTYSVGDVFRKNPLYPRQDIERAISHVVDQLLWPKVFVRSKRSLDWAVSHTFEGVTGVALTGVLTFAAAHGLEEGDEVAFTSLTGGSGAALRSTKTHYTVLSVLTTTTLTLGEDGSWLDFVTDISNATVVKIDNSVKYFELNKNDYVIEEMYQYDLDSTYTYHPFPTGWWDVVTDLDTGMSSTGRAVRLASTYSYYDTVYYTARSKTDVDQIPDTSGGIASDTSVIIPDDVGLMIPWGAVWVLLASTRVVPTRVDPQRSRNFSEQVGAVTALQDAQYFRGMFDDLKGQYRRQMQREKSLQPKFRRGFVRRS